MTFLKNEIELRALPDVFTHTDGTRVTRDTWQRRRNEMRKILAEEEYGFAPTGRLDNQLDDPTVVSCRETKKPDINLCAGKVRGEWFDVAFPTPTGEFSFPVCLFVPNYKIGCPSNRNLNRDKCPLILHINFRPDVPDKYLPLEELTDAGFAIAQIYYKDVTSDDGDYTNGLAGCYPEYGTAEENRTPTAWGKLRMWAFAASRLLDVLVRRDDIDPDKIVVAGHSRLGKTALLAAAMDDRFAGACSNDSGCSGAAITRSKIGETVEAITRAFPFWFCPNYRQYANREYEMPFDQHFLTALIAPRPVCIGSAWEDSWADPAREFLTAVLTGGVNTFLDSGVVPTYDNVQDNRMLSLPFDRYPCAGEAYTFGGGSVQASGRVHYHLRHGTHYFSREDWNHYLAFWKLKFFK